MTVPWASLGPLTTRSDYSSELLFDSRQHCGRGPHTKECRICRGVLAEDLTARKDLPAHPLLSPVDPKIVLHQVKCTVGEPPSVPLPDILQPVRANLLR